MRRDELPIPLPCSADWDTMTPAGKKRFCAECKKHVHDLSRMTEAEARAILDTRADLCIRYVYDAGGNVVFDRETVPANALVRARRFVTAAAALALPLSLTACMGARAMPEPRAVTAPQAIEPKTAPTTAPNANATKPSAPTAAGDAGTEK